MPYLRLADGIALSLNWSPRVIKIALRAHHKIGVAYRTRLDKARLEATTIGKIKVAERGALNDGSDWIIEIRSLVSLADEYGWPVPDQFKKLGLSSTITTSPKNTNNRRKKTPPAFISQLQKVISEIADRAATKGIKFSQNSMDGTKKEFWDFARKSCAGLDVTYNTFDTYIHGICKFKPGRSQRGYYLDLFDGLIPEIK